MSAGEYSARVQKDIQRFDEQNVCIADFPPAILRVPESLKKRYDGYEVQDHMTVNMPLQEFDTRFDTVKRSMEKVADGIAEGVKFSPQYFL